MNMRMNRFLLALAFPGALVAGTGCAAFRPAPLPEPELHPPPAIVEEVRVPLQREKVPSPARQGLSLAQGLLALEAPQADWLAGDLLPDVAALAQADGEPSVRAQALFLRGLLLFEESDSRGAEEALEQAWQAERHGPYAGAARLVLNLIRAAAERREQIRGLQARLTASEEGRNRDQGEADELRAQVEALTDQIEELKEVHLRVESEKEDSPS
jgi:hypothetical protein